MKREHKFEIRKYIKEKNLTAKGKYIAKAVDQLLKKLV